METVNFKLDPTSKVKLHYQLKQKIITLIEDGTYKQGSKIPSVRLLSEKLSISKNTVLTAYKNLVKEGYLESIKKSGFIVKNKEGIKESNEISVIENIEDTVIPTVDSIFNIRKGTDIQKIPIPEEPFDITVPINIQESIVLNNSQTVPIKDTSESNQNEQEELDQHNKIKYIKDTLVTMLKETRNIDCSSDRIVISNNFDELLLRIYQITCKQNKLEGVGLLKLAQKMSEGNLPSKSIIAFGQNEPSYLSEIAHTLDITTAIIHENIKGISVSELYEYNISVVVICPANWQSIIDNKVLKCKQELIQWIENKHNHLIIEYDTEVFSQTNETLFSMSNNDKVIFISSLPKGVTLEDNEFSYCILPQQLMDVYNCYFNDDACLLTNKQQDEAFSSFSSGSVNNKMLSLSE